MMKSIGITVIAALPFFAQSGVTTAMRIREHVRFLSGDWLEGRGVGQRGGDLAAEYIADQFALAGAQPAGENGSYFQRVPLVGVETAPGAELSAAAGDRRVSFEWLTEFVGASDEQKPDTRFDLDAIFVGHGITAPEWNWDDFKGVDVRGKVLVLFTNEPPSTDPKFFEGRALTYFGRWTYKYEEALRRGAVAAIIIHTTPTAGYGWDVVRSSWGREDLQEKLGKGDPVNGDDIYNGAIDNATGCGILLELARDWAARPQKPRRSALFLAVTGEEGGLRGSEFYATHPRFPLSKTAIDLNYDGVYPWGRAKDIVIDGAQRTTVWPLAQAIARRLNLTISPDSEPEQGHYFRSDHFSFAHVGIPAFSIDHATEFAGKTADFYRKSWQEFNEKHYHQPSDEFHSDWDFTALEQAAEFGLLLGSEIANQDKLPDWRPGDPFRR